MVSEGEKTTETNILSKQNKAENPNWPETNIKHVGYLHASLVLPSGREWNSGHGRGLQVQAVHYRRIHRPIYLLVSNVKMI